MNSALMCDRHKKYFIPSAFNDFSASLDATQGYFIVGAPAQIETYEQKSQKMIDPNRITHIGVPYAASYEFSPVK